MRGEELLAGWEAERRADARSLTKRLAFAIISTIESERKITVEKKYLHTGWPCSAKLPGMMYSDDVGPMIIAYVRVPWHGEAPRSRPNGPIVEWVEKK